MADPGDEHLHADRAAAPAEGADVFAERLLQIIDEGQRTATYKLALLLALIDASAAHADASGRAPDVLHTRDIAAHVLRLYLPQTRRYLAGSDEVQVLRQITSGNSTILGAVIGLFSAAEASGCRLSEVAAGLPDEYNACLDVVELTVARFPILRLQVVGRQQKPFLYDVDWSESVGIRALSTPGGGQVRFRPGAGDHLLRLAPLVRPLVELHWTRMVARLNGLALEEERLRAHLFGADRAVFPTALRTALVDLHDGTCFYCGDQLRSRIEIDHFIPWSRWPNDAVENLVPADRCNTQKRDFLPALTHVERWRSRLVDHGDDLVALGRSARWETDSGRSLALARSCYAHVPHGTPMWLAGDRFADDDPARIVAALGTAAPSPTPCDRAHTDREDGDESC